jgi:hypothetical protein
MSSKKSAKSTESKSLRARLKKSLPKIKPGTPEPMLWAVCGALIGMGVSLGGAALNESVEQNLQFVGLLLEKLLQFFPVAMAGALIGAFIALGWFGCRR